MQHRKSESYGVDRSAQNGVTSATSARSAERADERGEAQQDAPPTNRASDKCKEIEKHGGGQNSPSPYFQLLRFGVDSLYLSTYGEMYDATDCRLKELKAFAQSRELSDQVRAQFLAGDHIFEVKDKGSRLYPYAIEDGAFRIQLSRSKRMPWAYVKVSANYLAAHTPQNAENAVCKLLEPLGAIHAKPTVGRCDLFVDFASNENMESWHRLAWVTRAKLKAQHASDDDFTGWSIGIGGVLSCRLYDKLKELEVSKKFYLLDLWRAAGWDGVTPVWRLEFEFRREVLAALGFATVDQIMAALNGLWSYATTEWLRLTLPQDADKTRSRWPIHPLWGYLSSVDWDGDKSPLTRRYDPRRLPTDEKIFSMGLNAIVNYMAREGMTDHTEGYHAFIRAMHDHYTSEFIRRKSEQTFHDYFDLKLGVKARQFNTMLNDPQAVTAIDQADIAARAEAYRKASRG